MNKYQEALKRLKQETAPNTYCADFNKEECINILQELVDKATPKKLIRFKNSVNISIPKCPICRTTPITYNQKHCDECGQALDCSKEDD